MLRSVPSTLLERRHRILLGDAARGSKGWEVQRIKPRVALPLRAVEVDRIAAADLAVEQGPLVERRRSIAVPPPSAPIRQSREDLRRPGEVELRQLREDDEPDVEDGHLKL